MVNYCVCTLFKSLFCRLFLTKLFKYCKNGVVFLFFFLEFFSACFFAWFKICSFAAVYVIDILLKCYVFSCFILQNVSSGALRGFLKFCFVFCLMSRFSLLFSIIALCFCGFYRNLLLFFAKIFVLCGAGVIFASVFGLAKR